MTNDKCWQHRRLAPCISVTLALLVLISAPIVAVAQGPGTEDAQWTFLGGDAWHTRYTPAAEINAENFEDLEVLWQWQAESFGSSTSRATPTWSMAS